MKKMSATDPGPLPTSKKGACCNNNKWLPHICQVSRIG